MPAERPRGTVSSSPFADDTETRRGLLALRDIFARTGVLHESQALQIRLLPFTVDPVLRNPDGVEAEIDQAGKVLRYTFRTEKPKPGWAPTMVYLTRIGHLQDWIRFLLGPDWRIEVTRDGEPVNLGTDGRKRGTGAGKRRAKRAGRAKRRR